MTQRLSAFGVLMFLAMVCIADEKKGKSDVTMFGGSPSRNLVNLVDKGIVEDFAIDYVRNKKVISKAKNLKWSARLGTNAFGGPIIANGRIYVGTNNKVPRNKAIAGDKGVMMCFDEKTGEFLWQIVHNKLPGGEENDCPEQGVASTPAFADGKIFYVSNRCTIVCADAAKGKLQWEYDMVKELNVYPCQLANSSPVILGDLVIVLTGHGVEMHKGHVPKENAKAPTLVAFNQKTEKLAWQFVIPADKILRGQWSSATVATVDGKSQILLGGGDGWMYGLSADKGELLWKFDCNPKGATPYRVGGSGLKCFIVGVPVVHDNKCYIAVGQEPDDGQEVGHLWCIDITKKPKNKEKDISPWSDPKDPAPSNFDPKDKRNADSGLVWHFGGKSPKPLPNGRDYYFGRTITTVAVHDGLVYASELAGFLHCLDAKTGKVQWDFDLESGTWCSPYYVDGRIFLGADNGTVYVFKTGRKFSDPKRVKFGDAIKVPPVVANGVLYVNTGRYLYAFK